MLTWKQLHKRTATNRFVGEKREEVDVQIQANVNAKPENNECAGNSILQFVASVFHKCPRDNVEHTQAAAEIYFKYGNGNEEEHGVNESGEFAHGNIGSSSEPIAPTAMSIDKCKEGSSTEKSTEEGYSSKSISPSSTTSSCSLSTDSDDFNTEEVSEQEGHGEVRVTVLREDISEFCHSFDFPQHKKDVRSNIDAKGRKLRSFVRH